MHKRRAALILLILSISLLACVSYASAAGYPVNPRRQKIENALSQIEKKRAEEQEEEASADHTMEGMLLRIMKSVKLAATPQIAISRSPSQPSCGDIVVFNVTVSGIADASKINITWGTQDTGRDIDDYLYWDQEDNLEAGSTYFSTEFQYLFYGPGSYSCLAVLEDKTTGEVITHKSVSFSIPEDGSHLSIEDKAAKIAAACAAGTKWQTLLNLHDWLMKNCRYDYSYKYYGADMLFRGTGVCDSYSKAMILLCEQAGIPVERTTSDTHAWNNIQLDGKWYQIDTTWDDVDYDGGHADGHAFFCLNSEIMQAVDAHALEAGKDQGHAEACASLDANYFVHKNLWKSVGDEYKTDASGKKTLISFYSEIKECFENGVTAFEKNIGAPYMETDGEYKYFSFEEAIYSGLLEYVFNGQAVTLSDKNEAALSATCGPKKGSILLSVSFEGWKKLTETGTLVMPAATKTILESAFEGTNATTVTVNSACTTIQSRAFAESGVKTITIPGSVKTIAEDAFEGCGIVTVNTSSGSAAETYAKEHGMPVMHP